MEGEWAERIMALEKEVAELKEAVRAVQERDGEGLKITLDTTELSGAIGGAIRDNH